MVALRRSVFDPNTLEETVTVSSAEILALFATPKELIAAPGATKYIVVEAIEVFNDHGGTDYAANAAGVDVLYSGGATVANLTQAWAQASADQLTSAAINVFDAIPVDTALNMQALVADPTLGDGDWLVHVVYRVLTFA